MAYIFIAVAVIIQALLFVGHATIYHAVVSVFEVTGVNTITTLRWIFSILSVSFISAMLIASWKNNTLTEIIYTGASIWLGAVFYLFIASILSLIGLSLLSGTYGNILGKIFFCIACVVTIYGVVNASMIQVTNINVTLKDTPEPWKGQRAVFVSDIHLGQVYGKKFSERIVEEINKIKPEVVFIGGDLFDGVPVNIKEVSEPFKDIKAPRGTYFITGNHEEFRDPQKFLEGVKESGMKILDNTAVDIGGITLGGVDYASTRNTNSYEEVLKGMGLDRTKPTILLRHVPDELDVAERYGVSLLLSGHTHRAQMFPLNFISSLVYRGYDYGMKPFKSMTVFTSSGVGTWGPPLKVGNPAEVVSITFM